MIRNLFNKKIFLIFLILVLIVFVMFIFFKKDLNILLDSDLNSDVKVLEDKLNKNIEFIEKLKLKEAPLKIYGRAVSDSEVDVYVEVPAKVTGIYAKLGDSVVAGKTILNLDNSTEISVLKQAQSSYSLAQAQFDKTMAGSREEDIINAENDINIKKDILVKAKEDTEKEIEDLIIFLDAILRNEIDDYFDHVETNPVFTYRIKNQSEEAILEDNRKEIGNSFDIYQESKDFLGLNDKVDKGIILTEEFLSFSNLLYKASQGFLGLSDSAGEEKEAITLAIKESIDVENSNLRTLKNNLDAYKYALEIAENTYDKIKSGATAEDINISKTGVCSSYSGIVSARTALSKKTIKAPISGKITGIHANIGKLLSSSIVAFSISNPDNLKIETNVPFEFLENIYIGKKVNVNDIFDGTVSKISPILDKNTGLAKIEINFVSDKVNILSGEIVKIEIEKEELNNGKIALPISSIFEEESEYFIYILDKNSKTKKIKIDFVKISGENIIILNNFIGEEKVVLNARGVMEGQEF